ncbi:MAG: hypothetical protein KAS13_01595, partial [Candidatus Omnitrophica bacterium]|nr:hypothetical protein [Candidatus Omnitrophota bacterium]
NSAAIIKIRKYNFPHLVDKQRKSVFYLGFGVLSIELLFEPLFGINDVILTAKQYTSSRSDKTEGLNV